MGVTFAGRNCALPDAVLRDLALERPPVPAPWKGKPNSFECPRGIKSGTGWILLSLRDLNALDINSLYPLVFTTNQRTVTFPKLLIVKAEAVNAGAQYDSKTPYLVELADRRLLYQGIPINRGYNVRSNWAPSVTYYTTTLNTGVEWTWELMIQDVWNLISGLGTAPSLPFTPDTTPEGFCCYGMSALTALGMMIERIGCDLAYDPIADRFSIVQVGTDGSGFAGADSAAQSSKVWDDYTQESSQARLPEKVRVLFPKQPMPTDGSGPWYTIDVADTSPSDGVLAGTYVTIKDDLPALYDSTGALTNGAALTSRANERGADWYRIRKTGQARKGETFGYPLNASGLTPAGMVTVERWYDLGDCLGMRTEIERRYQAPTDQELWTPGDQPEFQNPHALENNARVQVLHNGAVVGTRRRINLIDSASTTFTVTEDGPNEKIDVTPAASVFYQSLQIDDVDQPQRAKLDLVESSNVTITFADQAGNNRSRVLYDLSDTGVVAGTYGDSGHWPYFTVDAKGRLAAVGQITDYYRTVQVNGSAQTRRDALDLEQGDGVTLTPTDDGAGNRTKVKVDTDGKAYVTNGDTTRGYLWDKIRAAAPLTKTKVNAGANEYILLGSQPTYQRPSTTNIYIYASISVNTTYSITRVWNIAFISAPSLTITFSVLPVCLPYFYFFNAGPNSATINAGGGIVLSGGASSLTVNVGDTIFGVVQGSSILISKVTTTQFNVSTFSSDQDPLDFASGSPGGTTGANAPVQVVIANAAGKKIKSIVPYDATDYQMVLGPQNNVLIDDQATGAASQKIFVNGTPDSTTTWTAGSVAAISTSSTSFWLWQAIGDGCCGPPVFKVSANFTAYTFSAIYDCDLSGGDFTATLPAAASCACAILTFHITGGASPRKLTISGSENIEIWNPVYVPATSTAGYTLTIYSDGTQWWIKDDLRPIGVGGITITRDDTHVIWTLGAFVAAGASHAPGGVPDPGNSAHSPAYLLGDDASFHVPSYWTLDVFGAPAADVDWSAHKITLGQTGLQLKGGDANAVTVKINETETAARVWNVKLHDADRTVDLSGNITVSAAWTGQDYSNTASSDIASASTTDLSTATGDYVNITGTTTITAFGTCASGVQRTLKFGGILTLTHNATSLILPGAANITTAAGDTAIFRSLGSGNWRCISYVRAAAPPVSGTNTGDQTLPTGANPTASVGLTAVNGSAATFMRSDGAPALDQSIAPTMTGAWIFSNTVTLQKQFVLKRVAATIQAGATPTCTPDLSAGAVQVISYVSGNLKIDNPTNNVDTAVWFIRLANTSGGAMGTLTWGTTFKQGTVTNPASGKSRIFCFYFDGTNNWKMFETADDL